MALEYALIVVSKQQRLAADFPDGTRRLYPNDGAAQRDHDVADWARGAWEQSEERRAYVARVEASEAWATGLADFRDKCEVKPIRRGKTRIVLPDGESLKVDDTEVRAAIRNAYVDASGPKPSEESRQAEGAAISRIRNSVRLAPKLGWIGTVTNGAGATDEFCSIDDPWDTIPTAALLDKLNDLGRHGWQVVSVDEDKGVFSDQDDQRRSGPVEMRILISRVISPEEGARLASERAIAAEARKRAKAAAAEAASQSEAGSAGADGLEALPSRDPSGITGIDPGAVQPSVSEFGTGTNPGDHALGQICALGMDSGGEVGVSDEADPWLDDDTWAPDEVGQPDGSRLSYGAEQPDGGAASGVLASTAPVGSPRGQAPATPARVSIDDDVFAAMTAQAIVESSRKESEGLPRPDAQGSSDLVSPADRPGAAAREYWDRLHSNEGGPPGAGDGA